MKAEIQGRLSVVLNASATFYLLCDLAGDTIKKLFDHS